MCLLTCFYYNLCVVCCINVPSTWGWYNFLWKCKFLKTFFKVNMNNEVNLTVFALNQMLPTPFCQCNLLKKIQLYCQKRQKQVCLLKMKTTTRVWYHWPFVLYLIGCCMFTQQCVIDLYLVVIKNYISSFFHFSHLQNDCII